MPSGAVSWIVMNVAFWLLGCQNVAFDMWRFYWYLSTNLGRNIRNTHSDSLRTLDQIKSIRRSSHGEFDKSLPDVRITPTKNTWKEKVRNMWLEACNKKSWSYFKIIVCLVSFVEHAVTLLFFFLNLNMHCSDWLECVGLVCRRKLELCHSKNFYSKVIKRTHFAEFAIVLYHFVSHTLLTHESHCNLKAIAKCLL